MPTLDWIGKRAVVDHHRQVPFHLLRENPALSIGNPAEGNLLVQGDNLLALKALLPYYADQVKCIYIDPPYNTGNEGWVYNDNVNALEISKWLGEVVGREADDLSRHDKWLCMMYPRLMLLKEFLRDDGIIFVSIGEDEVGNLRCLLDEVFGIKNRLGTLVWKRRSSSAMRGMPLSVDHEYILAYGLDSSATVLHGLAKGIEAYPYEDEDGRRYASTDLTVGMSREVRPGQFYPITNPRTGVTYEPNPARVWRFFPETMRQVIQDDLIIWPDEAEGNLTRPRFKTVFDPVKARPKPVSTWITSANTNDREVLAEESEYDVSILAAGMTQEGGRLLQQIFGSQAFAYPKPLSLVRSLIRAATRNNDIVLDSFAGSGTTGHAVLDLNNEDGGNRRFLLCELEQSVAQEITAERLRRVSEGYGDTPGLGGGFRYFDLGPTLFDADGRIREEVSFAELARHVYFTETGHPLPEGSLNGTPLLGVANGIAVYLLYNGILKDKSPAGGNVLTREVLTSLPPHDGPKVVYGTSRRVSPETLRRAGIVFRQTPYEIRTR
ncbi:MAG: site-specific DNA-methyltransferase [Gemmatimonadota bacterium]